MEGYWTTSGTGINTSWKTFSSYGDNITIIYTIKK
jgi:hypothetical protein